jgi:hypothetical protein
MKVWGAGTHSCSSTPWIQTMLRSLLFAVAFPILVLLLAVGAGIVEELVNRVIDYSFSGRSANPWAAGAVYLCLGALIGFATADLLPRRLFPVKSPFSGISLLLAPLGTGLLMQFYGSWRAPAYAQQQLASDILGRSALCIFYCLRTVDRGWPPVAA